MPVLSRARDTPEMTRSESVGAGSERNRVSFGEGSGLVCETCANPDCATGWLHVWRSRSAPVFEGGWNCSADARQQRMRAAVRREFEGRGSGPSRYRHRMPLGLLMMEQGWITRRAVAQALEAQKTPGVAGWEIS